jgi:hypothetical protein
MRNNQLVDCYRKKFNERCIGHIVKIEKDIFDGKDDLCIRIKPDIEISKKYNTMRYGISGWLSQIKISPLNNNL